MKKILKNIFNPQRILIYFVLFAISIIFMYVYLDYTYKKLKTIIILTYFVPGILFFIFSSIYNIKQNKSSEISIKLIILLPLLIIVLYVLCILTMLGYAMIYK